MKLAVVNCFDWSAGTCTRGLYGGRPSPGVCAIACRERRPAGDGPAVAWQEGPNPRRPERPPVVALPRVEWPLYARAIARAAEPADVGVGDTIERGLGSGGRLFKAAYKKLVGRSCGCDDRRAYCNARFPYAART